MVMTEVKRAFNPAVLNRLDEGLFQSAGDEDLLRIMIVGGQRTTR